MGSKITKENKNTISYPDGSTFIGWLFLIIYNHYFNIGDAINNLKEGHGIFIDKDQNRYEGEWVNDMKHGKGTMYMKNGELYIGDW